MILKKNYLSLCLWCFKYKSYINFYLGNSSVLCILLSNLPYSIDVVVKSMFGFVEFIVLTNVY